MPKQPRTKCRTNQHQKRGIPVLRIVEINHTEGYVTFEDTGRRHSCTESPTEFWAGTVAEMLGYTVGQICEFEPPKRQP